jgi:MFS family permease
MHTSFNGWRSLPAKFRVEFNDAFRSLKNRNFRIYAIGQLISVSGTWMQSVALSWLVYQLTSSPLALGIVSFASLVPVLLLSFFAGGVADRIERKKIIRTTQICGAIQATALAVLTITGTLTVPWVVALALFLGLSTAFDVPARQAFVADLVDKGELINAVGLNSAIFNISRMVGPVLAGLFIGWVGVAACFVFNAVTYLAALVTLSMVIPRQSGPKRKDGEAAATVERIGQVLRRTGVADLLVLTSAMSIFGFQFAVLMPVIVKTMLGGGAQELGYLNAALGVGALVGSLSLAARGKGKNIWLIMGVATLVFALAVVVLALSKALVLSLASAALAGMCMSTLFVGGNTQVQTSVPEEVRGRVLGIYTFTLIGLAPFGSLIAGWAAQALGIKLALLITAVVCASAAAVYLWLRRKHTS